MANLGDLTYTLGLNDTDFNRKIQDAARQVGVLDSSVRNVVQSLNGLKDISINISGIPKDVGTTNVSLVAGNIDQFRSQVESALQGMQISGLSVDVSSVKSQLQSQLVDIRVTLSNDGVQDLLRRIKEKVGIQKITVKVTPDWSRNAIRNLQNSMQTQMRNLDIKGVKLTIDRAKVQSELSRAPFYAELQLKVNRSTVSETIQSAVNQQSNLTNEERKTKEATQQTNEERKKGAGWQKTISDHMRTTTQLATILGNTFGNVFGAYQLKRFLENLIQIGGEIQKQRMALGHLLGSESEANTLFTQMKDLAVKSPFGLLDLTKNARQLTAFGVEYNNLYDTMKRLSDVAAGLGIQFGRLSLAYGETMERGFLDGKLVRQFAYMGLPVLQKVAEYYTRIGKIKADGQTLWSASDVRSLVSDRGVSFEDVREVFKTMTDEGGQFYNMQEIMAESVAGKWKNVQDALDIFYSDIAESNSEMLKMPAEIMTTLLKNYKDFEGILIAVAAAMVGTKGASFLMARAMGVQSTEALRLIKSERELELTEKRRQLALNGNIKGLYNSIRWRRQLTMEEVKASVAKNNLSYAEERELASKLKLNKANAQYLFELKLITKEQYKAVMSGNAVKATWTQMMYSVKGLGRAMALAATQAAEMMAVMMADPMTWIFAAIAGIVELGTLISNNNEKVDNTRKSMSQLWNDVRKNANAISDRVEIDIDNSSLATTQTAIDELVTFIKDNMPGAQEILNKAFALNDAGQYEHDIQERYRILKEYYDKIKELSEDPNYSSFLQNLVDKFSGNWWNATIGNDDLIRDVEDLADYTKRFRTSLNKLMKYASDEDLYKWERHLGVPKEGIVDKLLSRDMEDEIASFVKMLNKGAFNAMTDNPADFISYEYIFGSYIGALKEYKDEMTKFEKEFERTVREGTSWGKDFKFGKEQTYDVKVKFALNSYIEKSTDSEWAREHMKDWFKTRWNIDLSLSGDVNQAKDFMRETFGAYAGESIADSSDNLKKAYKKQKEVEKAARTAMQEASKKGNMRVANSATDEMNNAIAQQADLRAKAAQVGIDLEKEYQAELNKSGNKSKSNADEQLKQWKKQKSMYDDMLSTFKNLTSYMSKADALKKMRESGIWAGFLPEDAVDEESLKKLYSALLSSINGNTAERKDLKSELTKKIFSFDTDTLKEESQRAVSIVEMEINKAAKQYDVWKSWFNATGNSEMAKNVALGITPQWDEHSTALLGIYADKFSEILGRKVDMTDIIFGQDMDEKTIKEMFGNNDAMVKAWKAIHDLIVSAGYDLSKKTADALKNMMSYSEKVAVLNEERDRMLQGTNDSRAKAKINSYYDAKIGEMSPDYIRFMGAVTTMTVEHVRSMADILKARLNRQLQMGVIDMKQYADSIKKVDEQVEKSEKRMKDMAEAYANGGVSSAETFAKQAVENANYEYSSAESKRNAVFNEYTKALKEGKPFDTQKLTKANEELEKARKNLEGANKAYKNLEGFMKVLNKVSTILQATMNLFQNTLTNFADMFEALGDDAQANELRDNAERINGLFGSVQNLVNSVKNGDVGGTLGSLPSLVTSPITAWAKVHDKKLQRQIDALKEMNENLSKLYSVTDKNLGYNIGGVYNYKPTQMEQVLMAQNAAANSTSLSQWLKNATADYSSVSYFEAQKKNLEQQKSNIEEQLKLEQDLKNPNSQAISDFESQIAELELQIQNFEKDMAATLYGIDFKDWASQLADSLVSAWEQGTDAAMAYKNSVSDMLKSVAKSVMQQEIIGTYLDEAIKPWLEKFGDNNGVMDEELFNGLANVFNGLQQKVDQSMTFMDAWNQIAGQFGYDMKQTDTSSLGASVSTVTEETADLLAGYINSVRADLSIQKEAILTFLGGSLHTMDDHYSMQESQLQQLRMIQSNTMRNADAAENIMSILDDVTNNRKQLNIA